MKNKRNILLIVTLILALVISGCSSDNTQVIIDTEQNEDTTSSSLSSNNLTTNTIQNSTTDINVSLNGESALDTQDMFTDKDLEQTVDAAKAEKIVVSQDITITEDGDYILSGSATDTTITIDVGDENNVRIALDRIEISNQDMPAIYVKSADKVFITTLSGNSTLEVSGNFDTTGGINFDAVIYSKSDITLNGTGTLNITSAYANGISTNDDLKVTGGSYNVKSALDGFEANDSIRIYDGTFNIVSAKDGFHCENNDDSTGYIYIANCDMNIYAEDDAIRGTSIVQIDDGNIMIENCSEGIEGTFLQINGGKIDIYSTDDGINATSKSSLETVIEINGGTFTIDMASGDTDGFDSNGSFYVNGGTLYITANSSIDVDGIAELNGGEVYVNGELITEVPTQQHGSKSGRTKPGR